MPRVGARERLVDRADRERAGREDRDRSRPVRLLQGAKVGRGIGLGELLSQGGDFRPALSSVAPVASRPTIWSHRFPRRLRTSLPARLGTACSIIDIGTQIAGAAISSTPRKLSGATPMTVKVDPLMVTARSIAPGLPPKLRCHSSWLSTAPGR